MGKIQSDAFRLAALRSERLRIVGLMCVLGALILVMTVRTLLVGGEAQIQLLPRAMVLLGGMLAYEAFMLVFVLRSLREQREPPDWTWILNVLIETLLPTVGILILTRSAFLGPYRSLAAPVILLYFFFIVLSTLRLSPGLCVLTGVFSAAGYLAVTVFTFWRYPEPPAGVAMGVQIYVTFGVFLLLGGLTAAGVARQIRSHVGAALREAEMRRQVAQLEHDLGIARSIQQGLLPASPPQIEGFEVAGWSQPADETGGDYYDWQQLPDGRTAFSLADVTGHGIGPALVTAVCRAYSRASFPSGAKLGLLMEHINDLLVEDLPPDRFVTFVVGFLDPQTHRMQLLSAGHGPIMFYSAEQNSVVDLDAQGIPFGVSSGFEYDAPHEIEFAPGDMLVLITDGFFEWANDCHEQFGTDRLKDAIREGGGLPADKVIAQLYDEVRRFAGDTEQEDDLTAVIIKRCAPSTGG